MIQGAVIKAFLGKLPWGKIFACIAIAGMVFAVLLYIRGAEQNRAKVKTLATANLELVAANASLKAGYENQISVLQESALASIEREKSYAAALEEIQAQPDTACARNSGPLRASVRLLRQRHGG